MSRKNKTAEEAEKVFLTDEEKRQLLSDLKSTMNPTSIPNDSSLAERIVRVSSNVGQLIAEARATSDINFTVNIVDYTVDCVATHLESTDLNREMFHELTIADDVTMTSWCPGGYEMLEELTKASVPARLSFQRLVMLKDLEERKDESQPTALREKKKRAPTNLLKGPATAPKKITAPETTPSHEVNMETALSVLARLTRDGPIPFYRFVLNPKSFVQSVYNVFIVSFLVHERHAVLTIGEGDELFIRCAPEGNRDEALESATNVQLISSVTPEEWKFLVEHLQLATSSLPDFCPKDSQYFQDSQLSQDLSTGVIFLQP